MGTTIVEEDKVQANKQDLSTAGNKAANSQNNVTTLALSQTPTKWGVQPGATHFKGRYTEELTAIEDELAKLHTKLKAASDALGQVVTDRTETETDVTTATKIKEAQSEANTKAEQQQQQPTTSPKGYDGKPSTNVPPGN